VSLRYAYNTNGLQNHRLEDAIALVRDAGYDGVALTLDIHHLDPFAPDLGRRAAALGETLGELGTVIETGARFLLDPRAKHEPTLVSRTHRDRRVAFLHRAIDVAAILGSECVSFWAGVPAPDVTRDEAWDWFRAGLEEVRRYADERGVVVAVEPEPGMLVGDLDDFLALDDDLALALDTGHCLVTGERDPAGRGPRVRPAAGDRRRRGHAARRARPPAVRRGRPRPAAGPRRARRDRVRRARLGRALARLAPRAHDGPRRDARPAGGGGRGRVRVCFVSRRFFPAISGMSVYAVNLLRELVAQGHDVTMVSQYRGDERGTRVYGGGPPPPVPGVKVIGLEALGEQDGGDFERDVATMADVVAAEHARAPFDVLHAQYGYPTGFAVLEASRRLGVPNVVSIQGGDGHWVGSCCETHRRAMVAVLDHAGEVLIGSPTFAQEVTDRLGTDPARFTIVPGAVDTTRFRPGPAGTEGDPTLLYHGRVDRRKGILDLLDALDRLDRPADLVVSGIGPDLDAARERAEGDDRVRFTGYAGYDAAPDVYRHGGVFVSPTYAEGFSNTILEAMASGLPSSRRGRSASSTACATARTACSSSRATSTPSPGRSTGCSATARFASAWRPPRSRGPRDLRVAPGRRADRRGVRARPRHGPGRRVADTIPTRPAGAVPVPGRAAPAVKTALAVSPHLDDAAFSAGGVIAGLVAGGWRVVLVTVFTATVPDPHGFALRCQTDKGIGPEVDYMALRRDEDHAAAAALGLGAGDVVHLPLAEAPHRGYGSAAELFGRVRTDDRAAAAAAAALGPVLDRIAPDRILAPTALGGHVDHVVCVEALAWLAHPAPVVRWRDTPYALREPLTRPQADEVGIPIGPQLPRKLDACAAYASQLGFQFGGEAAMREQLTAFAEAEGRRLDAGGPAEGLLEPPPDPRRERAKAAEAEREDRVLMAKLRAQVLGTAPGPPETPARGTGGGSREGDPPD
jgi:glycosyltransferase involved in cell wall biosynthesis/sugar phosphate isomerase/epimerase/LmbE family N-acetylglucosaminyl deacetylase